LFKGEPGLRPVGPFGGSANSSFGRVLGMILSLLVALAMPQAKPSKEGEAILKRIIAARELPNRERASEIVEIARTIGNTASGDEKVTLASLLMGSATEGDLGKRTLQVAADTLVQALKNSAVPPDHGQPAYPYVQLAQVERYEGTRVSIDDPEYREALKSVDETLSVRGKTDFSLGDLQGHTWQLSALKGKVVMLNFWATWCPPCRKEMPDLQAVYERFRSKGLIVLAVSDEEPAKVRSFAEQAKWTFPVLLDTGGVVGKLFRLESLPKTFVYDRDGKLSATGIDMRTRQQLLQMLATAKLK
jgi:peroxiredoxin